ncbi:hypothetical protein [Bacillus phage SPO1L3]|nr:hypothetical protein Goe9_c00340 [Bacillus phage vB_BsuM-Goe9]WIT26367.1 hypothetical protein [Bacillus phage SPO1L3]WIT26765.1 hypothetical protein [Bacillus phage SPO1L5]
MLKTAKEVRETKTILHPTTERVRSVLREIQDRIDEAVDNNKSSVLIKHPCGDSKEEQGEIVGDLTEVIGTLRSHGYSARLGPIQDERKNPLWVIYCSF